MTVISFSVSVASQCPPFAVLTSWPESSVVQRLVHLLAPAARAWSRQATPARPPRSGTSGRLISFGVKIVTPGHDRYSTSPEMTPARDPTTKPMLLTRCLWLRWRRLVRSPARGATPASWPNRHIISLGKKILVLVSYFFLIKIN
jgi:hypothetical protein